MHNLLRKGWTVSTESAAWPSPGSNESSATCSLADFSHQLGPSGFAVAILFSKGFFGTSDTQVTFCLSQLLRQCPSSCGTACFSLYCFHLPVGWSGSYAVLYWPTSKAISVRGRHPYEINVQASKEVFFILSICLLLSWESFQEASGLFMCSAEAVCVPCSLWVFEDFFCLLLSTLLFSFF